MGIAQDDNAPEFETYCDAPESVAFDFFGVSRTQTRFMLGNRVFTALGWSDENGSHMMGVGLLPDPKARMEFFATPLATVRVKRYASISGVGTAPHGHFLYILEDVQDKGRWWLTFGTRKANGPVAGGEEFLFDPLPEARADTKEG